MVKAGHAAKQAMGEPVSPRLSGRQPEEEGRFIDAAKDRPSMQAQAGEAAAQSSDGRGMQEQPVIERPHSVRAPWIDLLPRHPVPFLRSQAVAAVCIAVALLLRLSLDSVLVGAPFITFFPAIVVAAAFGGRMAGISVLLAATCYAGLTAYWRPVGNTTGSAVATGLFVLSACLMIVVIDALQSLARELRRSQERADILAREMRHRVGNVMQLVQAIAQMTARSAKDADAFLPVFTGRIQALAEAHRLSSGSTHAPASLHALVEPILAAFDRQRIEVTGPAVGLCDPVAANLALVLHELATNATKYGALSRPEGRVRLFWAVEEESVAIDWTESGGPATAPPARTGFGTRLIQAALIQAQGEAELDFAGEGLRCRIRLSRWHRI